MGDDDRRPPLHQPVQRLQHQGLALRVERAGRLVEDEHRRVAQHGPGDGNPLSLAAGQLHAALADARLVAVGEGGDEVVGVGRAGRLDHLGLGRARAAVGDVLQDGAAEQKDVLRHDRQPPAQGR